MPNRKPQNRLPSFASRDPVPAPPPRPARGSSLPRLILDVLHKVLTGGAALATILRLLF